MIILLSVVLPQPLSPTRPSVSPRLISKLTLSTAFTTRSDPPNIPLFRIENAFLILRTVKIGAEPTSGFREFCVWDNKWPVVGSISRIGINLSPGFILK